MRRVESLLAVLSILPGLALAQNGSIRGRVTDATGAPLSRATISAEAAGVRATSDEQGRYEIRGVAAGTDIVRPFTLRGLSPDQTLVLVNGWRRHQTALVNTFAYGTGAGSSGVDLNAIPSSAIDRIDVLRDGAAAQYGSDAIAGVVNMVLK